MLAEWGFGGYICREPVPFSGGSGNTRMMTSQVDTIEARLKQETGTLYKQARRSVALVYPSPYEVGMASLGFQTIYRRLNDLEDVAAERAFLLDEGCDPRGGLLTYETRREVSSFPVLAFSVAYELELPGFFSCLKQAGISPLRSERSPRDPWIVAGGPLTFSNPVPLGPFVDIVLMGEAEDLLEPLMDALFSGAPRAEVLQTLAGMDGFYIPEHHGEELRPVAKCRDSELPAYSAIVTPNSALSDMFLLEPERGCSRGCTFCVMRRTTNGGMRLVSPERVMELVPEHAKRVGLVGAAVTDHPKIVDIVRQLVESGRGVGISSLRADRLTPEFVELLLRGGYRTLTIASDGASEKLRIGMEKKIREKHLFRTAEYVKEVGVPQLKIYMMLGVPGESDEDIEELVEFGHQINAAVGYRTRVSLGLSPFVAKRNTPLDGSPFVGIKECDRRIALLRKGLRGSVELRSTSARWAWVEYEMAQGGWAAGLAAHEAWKNGAGFAAWRQALKAIGRSHRGISIPAPQPFQSSPAPATTFPLDILSA